MLLYSKEYKWSSFLETLLTDTFSIFSRGASEVCFLTQQPSFSLIHSRLSGYTWRGQYVTFEHRTKQELLDTEHTWAKSLKDFPRCYINLDYSSFCSYPPAPSSGVTSWSFWNYSQRPLCVSILILSRQNNTFCSSDHVTVSLDFYFRPFRAKSTFWIVSLLPRCNSYNTDK